MTGLNLGLLVIAAGAVGMIALALFVDPWSAKTAAYLIARMEGRKAYRKAFRAVLDERTAPGPASADEIIYETRKLFAAAED